MTQYRILRGVGPFVALVVLGATSLGAPGCCPDDPTEVCHTLEEWRTTSGCVTFPESVDGSCPDADAASKSCHTGMLGGRKRGDKCCYDVRSSCE
jgi:hypothetical protein